MLFGEGKFETLSGGDWSRGRQRSTRTDKAVGLEGSWLDGVDGEDQIKKFDYLI